MKTNPEKHVIGRTDRGRYAKGSSGNPHGRKKGESFMDDFLLAKATVEKAKRKKLLVHFVEQAYEDNRVLIACIDRLLPALKAIEFQGTFEGSMSDETVKAIQTELKKRF